jgi:hypothetical protein
VRAADSGRFDFARSSVARVKELFFLLTKTYIEVGNPEVIHLAEKSLALIGNGSEQEAGAQGSSGAEAFSIRRLEGSRSRLGQTRAIIGI